jgi:CTP synthase (UTP-ammonia lyase)
MTVHIALVGDRDLRYLTHRELDATLSLMPADVDARWLPTDEATPAALRRADGLWLVPGTPYRDGAAAYAAIEAARRAGVPILGTCGGFHYMMVEYARNVAGLRDAAHAETDPDAPLHAVAPLACSLIGQERTVTPVPGTRLAKLCGTAPFSGFHFCSYGLAAGVVERLEAAGLVISATAADAGVEAVELPSHPFYLATLFQPQVGSLRTGVLHPLVGALIAAARGAAPAEGTYVSSADRRA